MKLKEIMTRDPITANEGDRLGDLQRKMIAAHARHLPVVRDGHLVGILSERDILEYRASRDINDDWWRGTAADAMHTPAQTANPDDSLTEAVGRMAAAKIGALPIVEIGKLVGIVTVSDVLAAEVAAAMR